LGESKIPTWTDYSTLRLGSRWKLGWQTKGIRHYTRERDAFRPLP